MCTTVLDREASLRATSMAADTLPAGGAPSVTTILDERRDEALHVVLDDGADR